MRGSDFRLRADAAEWFGGWRQSHVRIVARIKTQSYVRFRMLFYIYRSTCCVNTTMTPAIVVITEVEYFKGILLTKKSRCIIMSTCYFMCIKIYIRELENMF